MKPSQTRGYQQIVMPTAIRFMMGTTVSDTYRLSLQKNV